MKKSYNVIALALLCGYSSVAHAGLFGEALAGAVGYVARLFKGPEDTSDNIRRYTYKEASFAPETVAAHRALHAEVGFSDHNLDTLLQAAGNKKMLFEARDPEGDLVGSLVLTKGKESGDEYKYELTAIALNLDASADKQVLIARNFWFHVILRGIGKEQKLGRFFIEAPVYASQSSTMFMKFLQDEEFIRNEKLTEERRIADPLVQDVYLHTFCVGHVYELSGASASGGAFSSTMCMDAASLQRNSETESGDDLSKRIRTGDDLKPF
jgi:hypothetical protein